MNVGLVERLEASGAAARDTHEARFRVNPAITRTGAVFKRGEDIVLGMVLLLLLSWLLLAIAIAIKVTSPGPVFFLQQRRGRNGRPFRCFKFRSMYHKYADLQCLEQTRPHDPRITVVGRILRRCSLDELPQLFNVIKGDMALVGPRPHALGTNLDGRLLHEMAPNYLRRYQMRPGITGWAQVNGSRGIIDTRDKLDQRLTYDLYYIAHWSLWFDFKILLLTFGCFFDKDNAF